MGRNGSEVPQDPGEVIRSPRQLKAKNDDLDLGAGSLSLVDGRRCSFGGSRLSWLCISPEYRSPRRARSEEAIVAKRAPHLPHNIQRTALQNMGGCQWMLARALYPAGKGTIAAMLAKGWIEASHGPGAQPLYRITLAGQEALKAQIPFQR